MFITQCRVRVFELLARLFSSTILIVVVAVVVDCVAVVVVVLPLVPQLNSGYI